MTVLDLDALDALVSAATEGPWEVSTILDGNSRTFIIEDVARWRGYRNSLNLGEDRQTADFIAASREAVPALVARVRELEAELGELNEKGCIIGSG